MGWIRNTYAFQPEILNFGDLDGNGKFVLKWKVTIESSSSGQVPVLDCCEHISETF
jgi:hypothetical protein